MFEKAARLKLRFDTSKGLLDVESLWDLPLMNAYNRVNLDDIARGLHRQLKNGDDVSFVDKTRKSDEIIQLKFDIVKHIIDTKLVEAEAAKHERNRAEQRQLLLSLIADKEGEALKSLPIDELRKKVEELS